MLVFAWMSTSACDWLDGGLRVELCAETDGTRVDVATDLGGGVRERVLPSFVLRAPLEEFRKALRRVPRIAGSLGVQEAGDDRVVLSSSAEKRMTTAPPPAFQIAPGSLYARAPTPPKVPAALDEHPSDDDIGGGWDD